MIVGARSGCVRMAFRMSSAVIGVPGGGNEDILGGFSAESELRESGAFEHAKIIISSNATNAGTSLDLTLILNE
jgi:hypothetical protein